MNDYRIRADERNVANALMADLQKDPEARDRYLNRELVKQAVMTKMICECGAILDMRDSVLVYINDRPAAIVCPNCWDRQKPGIEAKIGSTSVTMTVIDARTLYRTRTRRRS